MQDFGNPDTRPLPDGWNQHYDASRNNWYYVQISVMPPKVSYQHPSDLRPEPARRKASRTVMPPPPPPMMMPVPSINPPTQSNGGSGLSLAQRLYASSNSTEQNPPLITATARDFANTTPHPPPIHTSFVSSLPTPPPSVSPSLGFNPPRTLPTIPQESRDSVGVGSTTDFYNNNLGFGNSANSRSAHSRIQSNTSWNPPSDGYASSNFSSPHIYGSSEGSLGHPPHPHRTQSYQIPPPPPLSRDLHHPHRASTFAANSSARPSSSSGPRILTTTARPPSHVTNISDSTPNIQTVASPPPSTTPSTMPGVVNPGIMGPSGLPSPPYSGSTSPPIGSPPPPPFFQGMPTTYTQPAVHPQSTSPPISPAQAAQNEQRNQMLKQIGITVGKTAGKAALKITGHALMNAAGIQPGSMEGKLFTGMGNSILNSDAIGALVNNLAGTNTGVDPSNLQAVLQGQPGADYQGIISALMKQQQQANTLQSQQSQPGSAVNYQALINELQKLQANAHPQQQALAQLQASQQLSTAQLLALAQGAQNPSAPTQASQLNTLQQQLQALSKQSQQNQQNQLQALLQQQQQSSSNQFNPSSLFTQNNTDFLSALGLGGSSGQTDYSGFSDFSGGGFDTSASDAATYASAVADAFAMQDSAIF